jgi:hypothetical protein
MGLLSRKPKLDSCLVCSELVEQGQMSKHLEQHVVAVTDENGDRAYTFECPRCGGFPRAYGARKPEQQARAEAAFIFNGHIDMGHDKMGMAWR